jgi:hypothetical protein
MTVQDLVQLLQQQAASAPHQIILNDAALGRSDLDNLIKQQLQRSAGNILVVVNPNDIPTNPPVTGFSLSGFLPSNQANSFLNLTNKDVTVNFVMNGTVIDFTLDVTLTKENNLPASWSFGTSFSDMPGSGLDSLDLSDPHFILATFATPYMQNSQLALSVGLNFYSPLSLSGPLDAVATLISKNPVQLSNGRSSTALLPSPTGSKSLSLFGLITWAASDTQGSAFDLRADLHIPSLSISDVLALETLFVGARRLYTTDSPPQSVIMIYMGATVNPHSAEGLTEKRNSRKVAKKGGGARKCHKKWSIKRTDWII